jgi:hypothetical protein
MSATKLFLTALAASFLLGGAYVPSASATSPEREPNCVFDKHEPVTVAPFTVDTAMDWGSHIFASGAQLFVPAREGLTKEWLTASVQQALASAHVVSTEDGNSNKAICDMPRLKDVHVGVVSAGNGYWVQLIGRDAKTAETLMQWARKLIEARYTKSAQASASR